MPCVSIQVYFQQTTMIGRRGERKDGKAGACVHATLARSVRMRIRAK